MVYSPSDPVSQPVVLQLPDNGLRLQFDGPNQRLRLIEVLDFSKLQLTYKNLDIVKLPHSTDQATSVTGPSFRHIYSRMFGPTYPGEYIPPSDLGLKGTYVLSYPGVAFSFPVDHSRWHDQADFVDLLSSSAASPASSMAIFHGSSWSTARGDLFTRTMPLPRSAAIWGKESGPEDIEEVRIHGAGRVEMVRKNSPSFSILFGESTPQDLVAELGPPDAIYRKNDQRLSIHGNRPVLNERRKRERSLSSLDADTESNNSNTDDSEVEDAAVSKTQISSECFYNYFHHGFDILISNTSNVSPPFPRSGSAEDDNLNLPPSSQPKVTKILLHGNIPGSYPFNRHRRIRWIINFDPVEDESRRLNSEMTFPEILPTLKKTWSGSYKTSEEEKALQRPMVLNRGWGDSPGSSCELLGGWEESAEGKSSNVGKDSEHGLGNTELFGFPGLVFEVLKNNAISCLTVY